MKKTTKLLLPVIILSLLVTGCGGQEEIQRNYELESNDYRGSVFRLGKVREDVLSVMNSFMEKNQDIRTENPSDFWDTDNFAVLSTELLGCNVLNVTSYFNEEQSTWEDAVGEISALLENMFDQFEIIRNKAHDYEIQYRDYEGATWTEEYGIDRTIHCTYDANHDWMKTMQYGNDRKTEICESMIEYGRNGKAFIIQTETERLYAVYNEVKEVQVTTDEDGNEVKNEISLGDQIVEFYYSRLDGKDFRLPKVEFGRYYDDEPVIYAYTEDGELLNQYSDKESLFLNIKDIDSEWVFSEGTYEEVLSYKDNKLTAKIQNHFNNQMEVFEFHTDGTSKSYFEDLPKREELNVEEYVEKLYQEEFKDVLEELEREKELEELENAGWE